MRLLNSLWKPEYLTKGRISALVGITILLFVYISLKISSPPPPVETTPIGRYEDPYSGEIITNNSNEVTPETFGAEKNEPNLLGISKLLDFGVSSDQFETFKLQLKKYGMIKNYYEISVDINNIESEMNTEGSDINSFTFPIISNRSVRHIAQLDCTGISAARLRIYDSKNNLEFDSKTIEPAPIDAD